MSEGFLKAYKVGECWKYTNEKIKWNAQDINLSRCVPKANVDHIRSSQDTDC